MRLAGYSAEIIDGVLNDEHSQAYNHPIFVADNGSIYYGWIGDDHLAIPHPYIGLHRSGTELGSQLYQYSYWRPIGLEFQPDLVHTQVEKVITINYETIYPDINS